VCVCGVWNMTEFLLALYKRDLKVNKFGKKSKFLLLFSRPLYL